MSWIVHLCVFFAIFPHADMYVGVYVCWGACFAHITHTGKVGGRLSPVIMALVMLEPHLKGALVGQIAF